MENGIQEFTKSRRERIRRNSEEAMRKMIASSGATSDCCGSAVLRTLGGDTVCASCLEVCGIVEVKR